MHSYSCSGDTFCHLPLLHFFSPPLKESEACGTLQPWRSIFLFNYFGNTARQQLTLINVQKLCFKDAIFMAVKLSSVSLAEVILELLDGT